MKYLLFLGTLALATACGTAPNAVESTQLGADATRMPAGNWTLTFDDEFDGSSLDTTTWKADAGYTCPDSQTCLASRWPENVTESSGYLHMVTKREERMAGRPYTTGGIRSAFTQQYGYVEARIRYANAPAVNNAVWLFTPGQVLHPFEIDINEGIFTSQINTTFHNWTGGQNEAESHTEVASQDLAAGFHIYAVQWDESQIVWYYDGSQVWRIQNASASTPVQLILSTMVMSAAGPITDALDGSSMDVDYIRAYAKQ
jgi:beta-glucanase (GH16 family)